MVIKLSNFGDVLMPRPVGREAFLSYQHTENATVTGSLNAIRKEDANADSA
jgi:hypothetical protein